jgi:sulfide:quinone oxidoreductase
LARKRNTRKNLTFNYFTGSKVLYDVPHYTPRLEQIYKEREIPVRVRSRLKAVDTAAKKAYFIDRNTNETFTEDYDFLHFAPPQSAPDFVKKSGLSWTEGKLAPEGWAMVDKHTLVHLKWKNIVSLGDVAGIPTSKTSAAIRKQVPIAVENLCSLIAGKAPSVKYDGYAACPIITDYGHLLMAEFDYEKKCCQSFPFSLLDTTKEIRTGWWLKRYVLKPMYFHLMLRGIV